MFSQELWKTMGIKVPKSIENQVTTFGTLFVPDPQ